MEGYTGFYLLEPISNFTGIQLDQINFIFVQLFGLVFGHVFRKNLSCSAIGVRGRHFVEFVAGFGMLYFCFRSHAFYLMLQSILSYIIILALPQSCGFICLVASMGILGVFHYERMHHNPLTYVTVNISGPLMINTQRITSLAYGIADDFRLKSKRAMGTKQKADMLNGVYGNDMKINGEIRVNGISNESAVTNKHTNSNNVINNHSNNNINNNHNNTNNHIKNSNGATHYSNNNINGYTAYSNIDYQKSNDDDHEDFIMSKTIGEIPSLLSVLSYTYSFHTVLCGPFSYYHDYENFINERITKRKLQKDKDVEFSYKNLNPEKTIMTKIALVVVLIALSFILTEYGNLDHLMETYASKKMGFVSLATYVLIVSHVGKFKYFIAWKLAEAVSCSAGFGFNGWDEDGEEKWDLNNNINMLEVEKATTLQMVFRHWNITTSSWLRYIVYERTKSTYLVFALSALWHGFFPGYYISFIGGAFFISVSKMARKLIRPYFVPPNQSKNSITNQSKLAIFYDIITILITKVQLAYLSIAFFLLGFHKTIDFYSNFYFCVHIINIVTFVVFMYLITSKPPKK